MELVSALNMMVLLCKRFLCFIILEIIQDTINNYYYLFNAVQRLNSAVKKYGSLLDLQTLFISRNINFSVVPLKCLVGK